MTDRILDLSAGDRAIWWDKRQCGVIYVDLRPIVKPDIVADSRHLPFADGVFDLVVFDPPHRALLASSHMATGQGGGWHGYGAWSSDHIRETIRDTAAEAWRVSRPGAFLSLKWNDCDRKIEFIYGLMYTYWRLLYGHIVHCTASRRRKEGNLTTWAMLSRVDRAADVAAE